MIFELIGDRLGNVTDGKKGGRCSRSGGECMLVKLNLPHPGDSPCFSREFALQTASIPGRRHRSSSEMLLGTIEPGVYPRSRDRAVRPHRHREPQAPVRSPRSVICDRRPAEDRATCARPTWPPALLRRFRSATGCGHSSHDGATPACSGHRGRAQSGAPTRPGWPHPQQIAPRCPCGPEALIMRSVSHGSPCRPRRGCRQQQAGGAIAGGRRRRSSRACTHKSPLSGNHWLMSALPPKAAV